MNDYDIPRRIFDTIIEDTIFDTHNADSQKTLFYVVKDLWVNRPSVHKSAPNGSTVLWKDIPAL